MWIIKISILLQFKVICFPTQNVFHITIEAINVQEAKEYAEEIANRECGWYADESDVTEVK